MNDPPVAPAAGPRCAVLPWFVGAEREPKSGDGAQRRGATNPALTLPPKPATMPPCTSQKHWA